MAAKKTTKKTTPETEVAPPLGDPVPDLYPLLQKCLDGLDLLATECREVQSWQFHRRRAGTPNAMLVDNLREEIRDAIG